MRHLDWLAEAIVELGGIPSLERGTMRLGGEGVADWMGNDVLLEEGAIAQYREHIEAIDDPRIKRLLRRILSDEESHRVDFQEFVGEAKEEGLRDLRGGRSDELVRTLNESLDHEYTVVLQYMFHSYFTPRLEGKRLLEDRAINEMQHMGWLAERIVSLGGSPRLEHSQVDRSTRPADMLRADVSVEREVASAYGSAAEKFDDPAVRRLLKRMRDHENYHAEVFSELLATEEQSG
jgi:bacterioferritin